LLVAEVFREKAETTKHANIMTQQNIKWRPGFQGVENKTFGLNLIQTLRRQGLPIKPLKADTDKVSRARPMAARYEIGTAYHKTGAPWLSTFEDELIAFPNGEHDDQVDTASYAGIIVSTGGPVILGKVIT
jgi:predicted phage terminase large subunit-like protein